MSDYTPEQIAVAKWTGDYATLTKVLISQCRWYCKLCKRCHANACPSLWGGSPEIPCGHK